MMIMSIWMSILKKTMLNSSKLCSSASSWFVLYKAWGVEASWLMMSMMIVVVNCELVLVDTHNHTQLICVCWSVVSVTNQLWRVGRTEVELWKCIAECLSTVQRTTLFCCWLVRCCLATHFQTLPKSIDFCSFLGSTSASLWVLVPLAS